jgi:hypothetical protein
MARTTKSPARVNGKPLPGEPAPFPSTPLDKVPPRYTARQVERTLVNLLRGKAQDPDTRVISFADDGIAGHGVSLTLPNGQRFLLELMTES